MVIAIPEQTTGSEIKPGMPKLFRTCPPALLLREEKEHATHERRVTDPTVATVVPRLFVPQGEVASDGYELLPPDGKLPEGT